MSEITNLSRGAAVMIVPVVLLLSWRLRDGGWLLFVADSCTLLLLVVGFLEIPFLIWEGPFLSYLTGWFFYIRLDKSLRLYRIL